MNYEIKDIVKAAMLISFQFRKFNCGLRKPCHLPHRLTWSNCYPPSFGQNSVGRRKWLQFQPPVRQAQRRISDEIDFFLTSR